MIFRFLAADLLMMHQGQTPAVAITPACCTQRQVLARAGMFCHPHAALDASLYKAGPTWPPHITPIVAANHSRVMMGGTPGMTHGFWGGVDSAPGGALLVLGGGGDAYTQLHAVIATWVSMF